MLKVGDRVKIVDCSHEIFNGRQGTIDFINCYCCSVVFDDGEQFAFFEDEIEKVE